MADQAARGGPGQGLDRPVSQAPWALEPEIAAEDLERIWAHRAAELARAHLPEDEGERLDVVVVRLGSEQYALEARYVRDIRPVEQITPVPRCPEWVRGVVNLRGRIISVVDLHGYLGLPCLDSDSAARMHLVVVETSEMSLALLADEVLAVESLPAARVEEMMDLIRGLPPDQVRGIYRLPAAAGGDGLLVVLDLPALLADRRLIVHEDVI